MGSRNIGVVGLLAVAAEAGTASLLPQFQEWFELECVRLHSAAFASAPASVCEELRCVHHFGSSLAANSAVTSAYKEPPTVRIVTMQPRGPSSGCKSRKGSGLKSCD